MQVLTRKGAVFSPCKGYRYTLLRAWDSDKPSCIFIGLNPSTADETEDDPTIRRCIRFARDWDCGAMYMLNLFAIRGTDPKSMLAAPNPIGCHNNEYLKLASFLSGALIVCAWGAHGGHLKRDREVSELLNHCNLMCLGHTKAGHPKHPLYLRADTPLVPYTPPTEEPKK